MKKHLLLSLIFTLCFYNFTIPNPQKFIFKDNLPLDVLHYAFELFGIKACDSHNHVEIKANAMVNGGLSGYLAFSNIQDIIKCIDNYKRSDLTGKTISTIAGLMNLRSLIYRAQFCGQYFKLFQESKKIAKFNKKIKLNLITEKIKQTIWLTFNIALPYLCYAAKRMYYDKINLRDAFYKHDNINDLFYLLFNKDSALFIGQELANMSENKRKYTLYKKLKKEMKHGIKQSL